jgi:hypothetical protein
VEGSKFIDRGGQKMMDKKRVLALAAATLVVGLVLGNIVGAWAAGPTAQASAGTGGGIVAGACGLGLKMGASVRDAGGRLVDVVAELTGLSSADVAAKRAEGQSIAQIAESKGVSSTKVVDEALKVREQLLAEKVKDGTITQAQADQALATMETRLTERVDSTAACGSGGCGMGGGGRGMGGGRGAGRGAGGCGAVAPTAPTVQ